MSARATYLEWRRQAAIGCVFARWLATRPNEFGQKIVELPSNGPPARIARTIAKRIDRYVADPSISAAALLLPNLTRLEVLARVALALRDHPGWRVNTTALQNSRAGELVAIHIVREIPFDRETCPSEALVLGPFQQFPPTRFAPVTAIEIFVGQPMPRDPKTHEPTAKANLAHMDLSNTDLEPSHIDVMWRKSQVGRLNSLGGIDDSRAKAKVSFVIPMSLARRLGCAP